MTEAAREALGRIEIVLVAPRTAGNVGAAARALKNMGLGRLTLIEHVVHDPADFDCESRRLAVDARDVLEAMRSTATLDQAIGSATHLVATTGKERRGVELTDLHDAAPGIIAIASERPVAILFGPEDHGLPTRLVNRAHQTIAIPSSSAYPSVNLSQAVMLVAYELRLASLDVAVGRHGEVVSEAELDGLHDDARDVLERIDFLKPHNGDAVMARLASMLTRANPTVDEVRMLRGICRQVRWLERHSSEQ